MALIISAYNLTRAGKPTEQRGQPDYERPEERAAE
jgi:hypothetical protein